MATPEPLGGLTGDNITKGSSSGEPTGGFVRGWAKVSIQGALFLRQLLEAQRSPLQLSHVSDSPFWSEPPRRLEEGQGTSLQGHMAGGEKSLWSSLGDLSGRKVWKGEGKCRLKMPWLTAHHGIVHSREQQMDTPGGWGGLIVLGRQLLQGDN